MHRPRPDAVDPRRRSSFAGRKASGGGPSVLLVQRVEQTVSAEELRESTTDLLMAAAVAAAAVRVAAESLAAAADAHPDHRAARELRRMAETQLRRAAEKDQELELYAEAASARDPEEGCRGIMRRAGSIAQGESNFRRRQRRDLCRVRVLGREARCRRVSANLPRSRSRARRPRPQRSGSRANSARAGPGDPDSDEPARGRRPDLADRGAW